MNIGEIKHEARQLMKGKLFELWLPFFICFIINIPFTLMIGLIAEKGSYLELGLSTVTSLLLLPMSFGAYKYYLNFVRKESYSIKDLFKYFGLLGTILLLMIAMTILVMGATCLLVIPGIILSIAYFAAPYIFLDDTSKGAFTCLKESRTIMKGHKTHFFLFNLSFIGWIIGCFLTLGLLLVYVYPYMLTAQTVYYDKLKKLQLTNK